MVYNIAPYERNGIGNISAAGTTEVVAATAGAFRNLAVGATIKSAGLGTETVTAKTDETHINVSAVHTFSAQAWTYKNPDLVLSGYYYIKQSKNDKPKVTPIINKDSDQSWAIPSTGVNREIQVSGWINNATVADREKNVTILEGLMDGTQTRQGTCVFTEESPSRTFYVYVSSATWQIQRDKPRWLDVMINMTECKNRGSL